MAQQKFVTFKVGVYRFGINVLDVREINHNHEYTPVPLAPEYVWGLINLRGQIVTLLDLRTLFGLGRSNIQEETHNIILKNENFQLLSEKGESAGSQDRVGFMVDVIGDIITVEDGDLEAPPANIGEIDGQYLSSVIQQKDSLVAVLDVAHLLACGSPEREKSLVATPA